MFKSFLLFSIIFNLCTAQAYLTPTSGAGSGSVTSVAMSIPAALLAVSGSPITSSGTFAVTLPTRAANLVFAGPSSGGVATPAFRSLVAADIPSLDGGKITTGSIGVPIDLTSNLVPSVSINTTTGTSMSFLLNGDLKFFLALAASSNQFVDGTSAGDGVIRMQHQKFFFTTDGGNNVLLKLADLLVEIGDGAHLRSSQTTSPTAVVNANAGTGATCTIAHATDIAGTVTLTTTAVSPSTGAQCAITFNSAFTTAPICTLTPAAASSAAFAVLSQVYVTSSTSVATINFGGADATGHTYVYNYQCIETK